MRSLLTVVLLAIPASAQMEQPPLPVNKLHVRAAAAPIPVLRYELLPNYREQVPGNAALSYHRAMLLKAETDQNDPRSAGRKLQQIDEMAARPAKEVKVEDLRSFLATYRLVLKELENGARREKCDWDLERRIDAEGISLLLPEVQKMRELAHLLSLRCRMHLVEGKVEEALRDIQFGFAVARHVGDGPTIIQSLVGMAFFNIFARRLEELMELPSCPNLYWSLTALPRPYFDMRRPLEGEMRALEGTLPMLRELDKGPMSVEQAQKMLDQWSKNLALVTDAPAERLPSRFVLAGMVALHHPNARKMLLASGRKEAEVNAMPAAQVVLLESVLRFKGMRDEIFIWFNVPYAEGKIGLAKAEEKFRALRAEGLGDIIAGSLMSLLPAVSKVHFASVRTERLVARLRTIEALRLHAAKNGHFPEQLSDITLVPVPDDPINRRPFEYERVEEGKAVLYGPPPKGETAHQGNAFKNEIILTK